MNLPKYAIRTSDLENEGSEIDARAFTFPICLYYMSARIGARQVQLFHTYTIYDRIARLNSMETM